MGLVVPHESSEAVNRLRFGQGPFNLVPHKGLPTFMNQAELRNAFVATGENANFVDLSNEDFTEADFVAVVRDLPQLPKLRVLRLETTRIGDRGVKALTAAAKKRGFPGLQKLWFNTTGISDAGVEAFVSAVKEQGFPQLQILCFTCTKVGDGGVEALISAAQEQGFSQLQELWLNSTQISDKGVEALALAIKEHGFPQLQKLGFTGTEVGDCGVEALAAVAQEQRLAQLQELWLYGTRVGDRGAEALSAAAKERGFPQLQELELHNTRISYRGVEALASAAQAGGFPQLQTLSLWGGTPAASTLPLLGATTKAAEIFEAIVTGVAVNEAKVVIVGEPGTGKSWLRKKFFEEATPRGSRKLTHGISLRRTYWTLPVGDVEVVLNVWDFGGQHILIGAHEMFLTENALCILVVDVHRTEAENRLHFWLKMINYWLGPKTPVVVVVTKCDEPRTSPGLGPLNADQLQRDYGFQTQLHVINSFTSTSNPPSPECLYELHRQLGVASGQLESLNTKVPRDWLGLRAEIEKQMQGQALLPLAKYRQVCKNLGIDDRQAQEVRLRMLHNLGGAFYFGRLEFELAESELRQSDTLSPGQFRWQRSQRDSSLSRWLINPDWIKRPLYAVVRAAQSGSVGQRAGWLTKSEVRNVVRTTPQGSMQSPPAAPDIVCGVLKLSELCLEVDGDYFFPRGLPTNAAPFLPEWWKADAQNDASVDYCQLTWQFIPESAIHRLLVRWYSQTVNEKRWRYGMVVAKHGCEAAVIADCDAGTVRIDLHDGDQRDRQKLYDELRRDLIEEFVGQEPKHEDTHWSKEIIEPEFAKTMVKSKKSSESGDARVKLIAVLTKHHKYADASCLNLEPIGNNELAREAQISRSSASDFFKKEFQGYKNYRAACYSRQKLIVAMTLLNKDYSPYHLFGDESPHHIDDGDED